MILRNNPTFCGTLLLPFIVLLVWQCCLVLGQDETQSDSAQVTVTSFEVKEDGMVEQEDEACPCILKERCPRVYGSNPLDYSEIGHFEPCKEDGYVRCCGVSVSMVQASEETETQYEDTTSWDLSESDQDHQEFSDSSESEDASVFKDDEDKSSVHVVVASGQQQHSDSGETDESVKDGDSHEMLVPGADGDSAEENKNMSGDKETDDDLVSAASSPDSYTVIVQPPGESPRKRFQPKFPRYGRPGMSVSPSVSSSDNDDNAGNNGSNEKTLPEEESKEKTTTNNYGSSYGNGGSGNVVYSQRVSEFSPYRRRNNVNTAPVFTITPSDSSNGESDTAQVITANRADRPKYQMRRRKPFNQMRNRVKQESEEENVKVSESEIETNDKKPEMEIYGASSSPDQSSPAPLHVSEKEASPESDGNRDELDNQRRPMSRLVKPRVNALNRRKPAESVPTKSVDQNESLDNSNSYGSTPTSDNGGNQESSLLDKEAQVSETNTNDNNNNKATIGSVEEASSFDSSSSAKTYENSPTGKLVPIRPKIRPFARKNPSSINSEDITTSENAPVNQNEEEELSSSPSPNSYDPIKSTEGPELKGNGVYIRKVPMRRVRPNPATVNSEKQEVDENSNDASDAAENNASGTTSPQRGKIIMRRPINSASSASLQMKDGNSEEESSSSSSFSVEQEGESENAKVLETPTPETQKMQTLDIRKRLLSGRKRKNPLRGSASSSTPVETSQENEKQEAPVEPVKSPALEPSRPNALRRRRPLRKPSASEQGQAGSNSDESSEAVTDSPDNPLDKQTNDKEQPVERTPIKIGRGPGRRPLLRRKPQPEQSSESETSEAEKTEDVSASVIPKEEPSSTPFLLRQRNRMSANNRGKVRNPLLPQSSESSDVQEESESSTSEAPVTVTSTYSRIRINNNKNGMVARPMYRRPAKPSSAPAVIASEVEAESTVAPDNISTTDSSPTSNQLSGYGARKRVRIRQKSPEKSTEEEAVVPAAPSQNEENVEGSKKESEKQGQLSQPNENLEESSSQPPKRRKFGRKRVKVVKPQQQEQEQRQQDYNTQEAEPQQQPSPQEDVNQQIHQEGDIRQNPEHVTSTEEAVTSHYPNSNQVGGSDEVKEELQSEDQRPDPGNPSSQFQSTTTKIEEEDEEKTGFSQNPSYSPENAEYQRENNPGIGNIGHENVKIDDADDNDAQDKKVSPYYHPGSVGENEPYDLILNQDVRKNLGIQGTHFSAPHAPNVPSSAYQAYTHNSEIGDGYHNPNQPESVSSPQLQLLNQDDKQYYDHYYYDQFGNNELHGSNQDSKYSNVHDDYGHYDHQGIPAYAHHYSGGDAGMGGIETIEIGTPDYDSSPYESWYAYGEGHEGEEESRVSMKFHSSQNKSAQVLESSKEESVSGNGSSNNSNDNDNEGKGVDISRVKVGPSRVIQRTVNHLNVSSSENNASHHRPNSPNSDNASENIRKDANSRIRQKLRRPPSLYINNSSDSRNRVPTTAAPFTPSLRSPRPTYSGQEALLESVNQSAHSLPKSENPSESSTYPNPEQLEQFIQHKQQIAPVERKNRTRVRIKMVTLRTTTPAPVANSNDVDQKGNEKNASPDAPSFSSFTFPPYKKSELTLLPTTTETPHEDDAPVPYSYSPPVLPPFKKTLPSTAAASTPTSAAASSSIGRKPLRNSFNGNHNQGSSASSSELPKTSAQVGGHDRQTPKVNPVTAAANGRFRVSGRNQTSNLASPTHSQSPSTSSLPSTSSDIRTTRRPQPRITSPAYIRKLPAFTTTEAPIRQQLPLTTEPPAYSNQENEELINAGQDLITSVPKLVAEQNINSKPVPSVPERESESEVISIRIEPQPNNEVREYDDVNEIRVENHTPPRRPSVSSVDVPSPSPNSIHHPVPHSFKKVSGKENYPTTHENKFKKNKYSRFKVPEKFNLPKYQPSPSPSQGENDDYGYDEYKVEQLPPVQQHHNNGFEQPLRDPLPTVQPPPLEPIAPPQFHFVPEQHNLNDNFQSRPPPVENLPSLEMPQHPPRFPPRELEQQQPPRLPPRELEQQQPQRFPPRELEQQQPPRFPPRELEQQQPQRFPPRELEQQQLPRLPPRELEQQQPQRFPPREQEYFAEPEPEVIPDIRINVIEPTVEQRPPSPMLHAIREPEHFNFAPPQEQSPNVLRNSPFGPFPSTDHWSGIPSPNSPRLPEYFENNRAPPPPQQFNGYQHNRGPPQPPPAFNNFEHNREPIRPPPPHSEDNFVENRRPIHQQLPPHHQTPANIVFEQNRDFIPPAQKPLRPEEMPRPNQHPVRFEEEEEEEEEEEFNRAPPPPFQETTIKFGTAFEENDDKEPTINLPFPQGQPRPQSGRIKFPDSPVNVPQREQPQFNIIREGPVQMPPMRPPALPNRGLQNEPVQLPLPPQGMQPQLPQTEVVIPPVRNQGNIEGHAFNEGQQPLFKPQLAPQEPISPMAVKPIMYEISNGELKTPHYPPADIAVAEPPRPNFNLPPHLRQGQQQQPQQFPMRQQNANLHLAALPVHNNNQQPPRAPHAQHRPEMMNQFPPHHQKEMENVVVFEGNRDAPLPPNNVNVPKPNILVQVDGRPHDATPINPGNNFPKPLDRPGGHVVFEKEPELKIQSQPPSVSPPSLDNNFQNLKLESHQAREPVSKPMVFPQSPQIRFPESNLPGFPERPVPRPGQFGPPPPSQQMIPQYVPFGSNGERLKLNETERPVIDNAQARPPVMPPPHFANAMKYGANQARPPYMPYQQQPPRQHGYMAPPMQSYPTNYQRPVPQMMMPGYPRTPYGNNPYFQQRLRAPNARTSRAANLTAEEEKALANEQAVHVPALGANEEQESLADQEAILIPPSNNQEIGLNSEQEQKDQIDKGNAEPSQFAPELRTEDVISASSDSSYRLSTEETNGDSLTNASENPLDSSTHRQQRELNINGVPRFRSDKTEQRDVLLVMHEYHDNHEDMAGKEAVKVKNFVQDQLAQENRESGSEQVPFSNPSNSMPHSAELGSKEQDKVEEEGSEEDPLKLSKNKKFPEHKSKQDSMEESNGKTPPSFSSASSNENKKSYMKGKNANNSREKSAEQIHQNSGKLKGAGKGENEFGHPQQGQHAISSINPDETQDQQEFVAPTVIQRGFHPILPYSEKDPGPILVQMAPKVEKFLPPPSLNSENVGSPFQILPPTHAIIVPTSSSPSLPMNRQTQESKSPFLSKQLSSNNHLAVLQTNTLANNQTPFKTLSSNHLTTV